MRLEAMAVQIPHVNGHPNRVPFEGVLTVVNAASDKSPAGARGHRVLLTREAAEKALPSLLGMAVDYRPGWDGQDARRKKVGILTEGKSQVRGLLCTDTYTRATPRSGAGDDGTRAGWMGMSYELADARVEDMRAEVWKLTRVTFTGAAILLRRKPLTERQVFGWQASERRRNGWCCRVRRVGTGKSVSQRVSEEALGDGAFFLCRGNDAQG